MDKAVIRERIERLRRRMEEENIDAYLVLTDDFHASEYVDDFFKCRAYLSGFTGSAGTLVITAGEAHLWVDSRYYLQAEEQLADTGIDMEKIDIPGGSGYQGYLRAVLEEGQTLGYDGRTVSAGLARSLQKMLAWKKIRFREDVDLVGDIWEDRPLFPAHDLWELPSEYTGDSRAARLQRIRDCLTKWKADHLLLSSLDDIAWLYHFRGNDVLYNPVFMSYTLISQDTAILYVAPEAVGRRERAALEADGVEIRPYLQVYEDLKQLDGGKLWVNEESVNAALMKSIPASVKIINRQNPTTGFKSRKTPVEMENIRKAHIQDGVAVTKLIHWMKKARETEAFRRGEITEMTVAEKYYEFRKERPGFVDLSFAPIIGSGAHGAIVHYSCTPESNIPICDNTFLLMDTGGQYMQGTTDITRTMAIGELTREMKVHYTAVLRGNLNLGGVRFAQGQTGCNLDILARSPLWELGLDYGHGTGHGVGYLLNVHEGPQSIRPRNGNGRVGTALEVGMLTSNEPGLYITGQYGIRCENLVLCVKDRETPFGQFLKFETVTMVPWERDAILPEMMTEREILLLDEYHRQVYEKLAPWLTQEERMWLAEQTRPFHKEEEIMIYEKDEEKLEQKMQTIREELRKKDPAKLAEASHMGYDPGAKQLFFLSLGKEVLIDVPEYDLPKTDDPAKKLTFLTCLNSADGTPVSGEDISVSELLSEDRAEKMEELMEQCFDRLFAGKSAEIFRKACKKLGGTIYDSDADVTATFYYTPMVPVTVHFWEETEETMASGDLQVDENATHYMNVEELCRAGILVAERIAEVIANLEESGK